MQPLGQMPPPVPKMRGNGAMNGQSLGQMPPPVPRKRGKGAMNKQKLIAPELSGPGNPQPARARSFTAVAPSATAAVRFGQHPQTVGVNQIFPGRDPRRCARVGEGHEASSSPVPASLTPFGRVPSMLTFQETSWNLLITCSQARGGSLGVLLRPAPARATRVYDCGRVVSPAG
jgi:hypothetical protein